MTMNLVLPRNLRHSTRRVGVPRTAHEAVLTAHCSQAVPWALCLAGQTVGGGLQQTS